MVNKTYPTRTKTKNWKIKLVNICIVLIIRKLCNLLNYAKLLDYYLLRKEAGKSSVWNNQTTLQLTYIIKT